MTQLLEVYRICDWWTKECGALVEWYRWGKTIVLDKKRFPLPLCQQKSKRSSLRSKLDYCGEGPVTMEPWNRSRTAISTFALLCNWWPAKWYFSGQTIWWVDMILSVKWLQYVWCMLCGVQLLRWRITSCDKSFVWAAEVTLEVMIVPCIEEVEMSVCEQLCMQDSGFQLDGILKLMPR
jgi:hypothetical protein